VRLVASASFPMMPAALLHGALAVACVIALAVDASPLLGVHPAVKPLKFTLSIAVLLATIALILPTLSLSDIMRRTVAWTLSATMVLETTIIIGQALRGKSSHFNTQTALDGALWRTMGLAIVLATAALVVLAWIASTRPIALDPRIAAAVRVALWLVLLVAASGFAMGGRSAHSIGGADGGTGLAVTNWSREHGDLRVPHFFALHGLQALPVAAYVLGRVPLGERARWALLIAICLGWTALSIATLAQAFAGRPLVPAR